MERHQFQKGQQAEVTAYRAAKFRCTNPKNRAWKNYGGRGIEFRFKSFKEFWDALGPRPAGKQGKKSLYTLERIDNEGHYEPGNVRWATNKEQSLNTRRTLNTVSDKSIIGHIISNPDLTYTEISERLGCSASRITRIMLDLGVRRGQGTRPPQRHKAPEGTKFSKWTVISSETQRGDESQPKWFCRCECGSEKWVRKNNLKQGASTNCGCVRYSAPKHETMIEKLKAHWTPERRKAMSKQMKETRSKHPELFSAVFTASRIKRKLTDRQVREIRRLNAQGLGCDRLAKLFDLAPSNISKVINGETYKDVVDQDLGAINGVLLTGIQQGRLESSSL